MTEPVSAAEFAVLMAAFEPFESQPRIAVAVSGGPDSMALALLAAAWAKARGGRAVALTVDHGLRRASRAEAARVTTWLKRRGIAHHVLRWRGPKPSANIQAVARRARYALLDAWCRRHGCLHLLLAHQRDDQAETVLLRLVRGSGAFGLAAMPAVHETASARHLRPLLGVDRRALEATLRAINQAWITDPSNRNLAFARVRLRNSAGILQREGASPGRIAATAAHLARARTAIERQVANCLAGAVTLFPEGYATLDRRMLMREDAEIALRALAAVLTTVAGSDVAPRYESLAALWGELRRQPSMKGRTLAGCRLVPWSGDILVVRELAAIGRGPQQRRSWDGRFARGALWPSGEIRPLGATGWAELTRRKSRVSSGVPRLAGLALPAVWDRRGLKYVPPSGFGRPAADAAKFAIFCPQKPLAGAFFASPPALAGARSTIV